MILSPCCTAPGRSEVKNRFGGRAQAGKQHIAVEPLSGIRCQRGGQTLLDVRMVTRARHQLTLAHKIKPRVATMNPGGGTALHQRPPRWWYGVCPACPSRSRNADLPMRGHHGSRSRNAATSGTFRLRFFLKQGRNGLQAPVGPPPRLPGAHPCRRPAERCRDRACSSSPCGLRFFRAHPCG
jgi:hypothetical protein